MENLKIEFSYIATVEMINQKIINIYNVSSKCLLAYLIILEAGENPNKDIEILLVYEQYYKDFEINNEINIEVICDKAIFWRVLKHHINKPQNTNKNMCNTLLMIFLSYRIYNLASFLKVTFLDKLE